MFRFKTPTLVPRGVYNVSGRLGVELQEPKCDELSVNQMNMQFFFNKLSELDMNDVCHVFHPRIAFQLLQRRLRLFNSDTNKRKSTWFQGPTMGKLTLLVLFAATFSLYGKDQRLMHFLHPVILDFFASSHNPLKVPLLLSDAQTSVARGGVLYYKLLTLFPFLCSFLYLQKKINSLRYVVCYCLASRTLTSRAAFIWVETPSI